MDKIFEYLQKEISSLIGRVIAKKIVVIASGLVLTISSFVWKYIDNRLSSMQNTINQSMVLPTPQSSANHYAVVQKIESSLLGCQQKGVFIGWLLIKTIYDTYNHQCRDNQSCPILHYSIYFDTLRGIWNNINEVVDIKSSNPFYQRTDLVLDIVTRNYFLNSNIYKNGIVEIDQNIVKMNNLFFLQEVYDNLDLRKQGLTLEKMYLKPIFYQKDLIMVFSLSFQKIPKYNNNCYDVNMQAQSIALNNLANTALNQYGIFNI